MPQNAPQPAPEANGGGFGGLGGILQNIIAPQSAARNKTVGWLTQQGLDPGTATILASDKGALRSYMLQRTRGQGPTEFDQRAQAAAQYGLDPSTPEGRNFILSGNLGGDANKQTSDMQEYELAKTQGFQGTFFDYQVKMKEAGRNQVNIDTGAKLPTGFMWNDPNDQDLGVKPIAGGPATQIPSEAAGRIGLADTFLNDFDAIKKQVKSGGVTGPIDAFRSRNQSSYPGAETYRKIQTGVDALQRMLTGAGMPQSEAATYAFRYLPTYTDDAGSMVTKLDRLKSELESIKGRVLQGREAQPGASGTPNAPPKIGESRYGYRFKGGDPSEPSNWVKAN
ncbi:hypothetical protein [Mesorhizobium sp.]|uniref:hypothetical protein n=1 Tax=Mesorhizobium sp. TaxID=1871066 RepID=UPI000FE9134E|nr:hypothetical protein [Mesorhizobium sp.]RWO22815.1 MAG: hypothetical protein EOS09_19285 [Mesorhizobium sp.]